MPFVPPSWAVGDYLTHRDNPELGIGKVAAVERRVIVVEFPLRNTTLRLAAGSDALVPVDLDPGRAVRVLATQAETRIVSRLADGRLQLADGATASPDAVWPLQLEGALLDRLAVADFDATGDLLIRLDLLHLLAIREAGGLGSFLGGRVRLFPHQLYVAEHATAADPVRWLLADEVGLGKTVEACLILNRLVHTRGIDRCLIVVPDALTVQWLGELWRKYHQVFTLLDEPRLADVARDFGASFNPFDVHRRAVIAIETLVEQSHLTQLAVAAGIDLLVVDEAQRLRRPPGHPGEPAWRAVAPIAALNRHVLLLSATPLEDDAHGFFRLLQMLRPDEFPEASAFEERLAHGVPLPPCTSSTRRVDIGGLPPRVGMPVAFDPPDAWRARDAVESEVRRATASDPVARRRKIDRVRRALASGAALSAVLAPDETNLRQLAARMDDADPRLRWLLARAPGWKDRGEKTLIFVAHRETLEWLRGMFAQRAQLTTGVFHEELSPPRRDTEVARFRERDGPSILVSTECGGEGRNFEFCRRLVLFDLPWKPTVVEQRIGRLDRIGRQRPVEIVFFTPSSGVGADVVRLFETLGVFHEPMAGLEPQLAHLEAAIEDIALDSGASLTDQRLEQLVTDARAARTRIREAAYQQLHRDPYRPELGPGILAKVPVDLDALVESVTVRACSRLGFRVERRRGTRAFAIEFGVEALVDSLPGVSAGMSYVGSFDREEAVEDESIDFFASGHPLVEGLLTYFEDSGHGRVARVAIETAGEPGRGLVAIYKDGPGVDLVAFDSSGRRRQDWEDMLRRRPLPLTRVPPADWRQSARELSDLGRAKLDPARRPDALVAIVVRPSG